MIAFCDFTTLVVTGYLQTRIDRWCCCLHNTSTNMLYEHKFSGSSFFIFCGHENPFLYLSALRAPERPTHGEVVPSLLASHLTTDSPTLCGLPDLNPELLYRSDPPAISHRLSWNETFLLITFQSSAICFTGWTVRMELFYTWQCVISSAVKWLI